MTESVSLATHPSCQVKQLAVIVPGTSVACKQLLIAHATQQTLHQPAGYSSEQGYVWGLSSVWHN